MTNTGGYYLFYRVASTGSGLPAEIFSQDPTATVSLLATVYATGSSTVALRPFHNTAVVVEPLPDPTAAVLATPRRYTTSGAGASLRAVAAELASAAGTPDGPSVQEMGAANVETRNLLAPTVTITVGGTTHRVVPGDTIGSIGRAVGTGVAAVVDAIAAADGVLNPGATLEVYPGWLSHRGALRAGAAGFRVVRADPDPGANDPTATAGGQDDPRTKLEVLFNLIGYRLTGDPASGFAASADGLPVGPAQPTDGPLNSGLTAVAGQDAWTYQKQIRVDRFARSGAVPLGDLQDPYAGHRHERPVRLAVPGRVRQPAAAAEHPRRRRPVHRRPGRGEPVARRPHGLPVHRSAGPGVAGRHARAGHQRLRATPGEVFAPVGSAGGSAGIAARAAAHRDRYAEIFWQVSHDLVAEVTHDRGRRHAHPVPVGELATFTAAAWGYLQTVARTTQATVPVPAEPPSPTSRPRTTSRPPSWRRPTAPSRRTRTPRTCCGSGRTIVVEARYSVIRNDTLSHIAAQAPSFVQDGRGPDRRRQRGAEPAGRAPIVVGTVHPVAAGRHVRRRGDRERARSGPARHRERAAQRAPRPGHGRVACPARRPTASATGTPSRASRPGPPSPWPTSRPPWRRRITAPLVPGSELIVPIAVTVVAGDTLAVLAGRFAVTAAEFAQANATLDALVPGAEIVLPAAARYTVAAHDTLASIAAASDLRSRTWPAPTPTPPPCSGSAPGSPRRTASQARRHVHRPSPPGSA